jgi:hypothetical protein
MLNILNRLLRVAGLEVRRRPPGTHGSAKEEVATLPPIGRETGSVLISYIPDDVLKAGVSTNGPELCFGGIYGRRDRLCE